MFCPFLQTFAFRKSKIIGGRVRLGVTFIYENNNLYLKSIILSCNKLFIECKRDFKKTITGTIIKGRRNLLK